MKRIPEGRYSTVRTDRGTCVSGGTLKVGTKLILSKPFYGYKLFMHDTIENLKSWGFGFFLSFFVEFAKFTTKLRQNVNRTE